MSVGSTRTRVGRRLAGAALVATVALLLGPGGVGAAPDDDGGTAGGGAAAVDILSNVDTIGLDLLGFTGEVVAPAASGTASKASTSCTATASSPPRRSR